MIINLREQSKTMTQERDRMQQRDGMTSSQKHLRFFFFLHTTNHWPALTWSGSWEGDACRVAASQDWRRSTTGCRKEGSYGHYGDQGWWTRYCRPKHEFEDFAMYSSVHASLWWRSCVIVTVVNGHLACCFCHFNEFINSQNSSGVQEQMAVWRF